MLLLLKHSQEKRRTKVNQALMVVVRGQWTSEALKEMIDVIIIGTCFLQGVNKSWNIHLSSLCDHLNGWTKSIKNGPRRSVNNRK